MTSADGVEVAVHDTGGEGQPLVAVHGTGLVGRMWEPVLSLLPVQRVRVLYVDLRGHGASRTPAEVPFRDRSMVADLCAVADAFGLDGALAAGHSMGAATALLTSVARPSTFSRVFAYEPIIFRREPDFGGALDDFQQGVRRRRATFGSRREAFDRYSARPPLDVLDPATLAAYVEHGFVDDGSGGVRLACDPIHEAEVFRDFLDDGFERLGELAADVLVAAGTVGRPGQEGEPPWREIAERIPRSRFELVDGADHFGPFATGRLRSTAELLAGFFGV
ncbi:MAG: alpha/beta hydrolase [Acidimicrobiia bacterium]|nr:alpha/beta hydrolase [Acidimicrobiia bacterium]